MDNLPIAIQRIEDNQLRTVINKLLTERNTANDEVLRLHDRSLMWRIGSDVADGLADADGSLYLDSLDISKTADWTIVQAQRDLSRRELDSAIAELVRCEVNLHRIMNAVCDLRGDRAAVPILTSGESGPDLLGFGATVLDIWRWSLNAVGFMTKLHRITQRGVMVGLHGVSVTCAPELANQKYRVQITYGNNPERVVYLYVTDTAPDYVHVQFDPSHEVFVELWEQYRLHSQYTQGVFRVSGDHTTRVLEALIMDVAASDVRGEGYVGDGYVFDRFLADIHTAAVAGWEQVHAGFGRYNLDLVLADVDPTIAVATPCVFTKTPIDGKSHQLSLNVAGIQLGINDISSRNKYGTRRPGYVQLHCTNYSVMSRLVGNITRQPVAATLVVHDIPCGELAVYLREFPKAVLTTPAGMAELGSGQSTGSHQPCHVLSAEFVHDLTNCLTGHVIMNTLKQHVGVVRLPDGNNIHITRPGDGSKIHLTDSDATGIVEVSSLGFNESHLLIEFNDVGLFDTAVEMFGRVIATRDISRECQSLTTSPVQFVKFVTWYISLH